MWIHFLREQPKNECFKAIDEEPFAIGVIRRPTEEMYLRAVKKNGLVLSRILKNKQSEKICLAAVKQNSFAISFVVEQTERICIEAVKRYGRFPSIDKWNYAYVNSSGYYHHLYELKEKLIIEFIKKQTDNICLAAVKNDWRALQFVENQTSAICKAAIKRNPLALQYVRNQTPDLCFAAIDKDSSTREFVKIDLSFNFEKFIELIDNLGIITPDQRSLSDLSEADSLPLST